MNCPFNSSIQTLFLSPSFRLTGYGIHHCFARSLTEDEPNVFSNFYVKYYTMGGAALASCVVLCPAVGMMGRRGGLLVFMIITALASLLQLGLLNRERTHSSQTQDDPLQSNTITVTPFKRFNTSEFHGNILYMLCF